VTNKRIDNKLVRVKDKINEWQEVIAEVEKRRLRAQMRASELKAVVVLFKEKQAAGEPCPGRSAIQV
jgi:hypothetical protein